MDATTLFILGLFLLVACAVFVGEAVGRLGLLPLVGQLAVGIVFGPTLLGPALGLEGLPTEFQAIQLLATFFVLITAGLAVTPAQIRATGAPAALLGFTIFLVPFVVGAGLVRLLYPGLPALTALFASLTVSVTALPVLAIMLQEFDLLKGRFGTYLLNGAFVNELVAVTAFSALLRFESGPGNFGTDLAIAIVSVCLFLVSVLAILYVLRLLRDSAAWPRLVDRFLGRWHTREAGFAVLMVAALAMALYSQYLGLTFLVGAFCAGLLIAPQSGGVDRYRAIREAVDTITWGFFIPLFFALVGLGMNLRLIGSSWSALGAFVALCVFSLAAKLLLGGAVTRSLGWSGRQALGAGFLVSSRGAVSLAFAVILLSLGVFSTELFTVVAGVALVSTLISPIGAGPFVRNGTHDDGTVLPAQGPGSLPH